MKVINHVDTLHVTFLTVLRGCTVAIKDASYCFQSSLGKRQGQNSSLLLIVLMTLIDHRYITTNILWSFSFEG